MDRLNSYQDQSQNLNPRGLASEFQLIVVLCRYLLYSFKTDGEICPLKVFSYVVLSTCVSLFSLFLFLSQMEESFLLGGEIWQRMYPKRKNTVHGRKGEGSTVSYFAEKGRLCLPLVSWKDSCLSRHEELRESPVVRAFGRP